MEASEQINELATALAKTQGSISGAKKDAANPFFKSTYADLEAVWSACRDALSRNGLSVIQTVTTSDERVGVTTMLAHSSGQWVRDTMLLTPKDSGPQAMGSCISYGRRYALAAIVGVYQTDDDAEAAHGRNGKLRDAAGDLSHVPQGMATDLSNRMAKALDADVDEDMKALKIYDIHSAVKNEHDLYIAAAELLPSKSRSAWKSYIKQAEKIGNATMR